MVFVNVLGLLCALSMNSGLLALDSSANLAEIHLDTQYKYRYLCRVFLSPVEIESHETARNTRSRIPISVTKKQLSHSFAHHYSTCHLPISHSKTTAQPTFFLRLMRLL